MVETTISYASFWLIYTFLIFIPFIIWLFYPQRKYYQKKLNEIKNKK